MSPIYNSSAFLQQCFAVHPLCLSFKKFFPPDRIGVFCTNCNMRHRITLAPGMMKSSTESSLSLLLSPCANEHPESLRISAIEMDDHIVQFRCGDCQENFTLQIALIETHTT